MRNRFDQLGKKIGLSALGASGPTVAQDEIAPDAQHADLRHEPAPGREAERARLGLLGRLASVPCLIEIYAHAPGAEEFRACLSKHLAFWQQRSRQARAQKKQRNAKQRLPEALVEPALWILAAGAPTALLLNLACEPAPGWPTGVYFFGAEVLRVGFVVASELPRDRSTLLVRLIAAGPLLLPALEELAALPAGAHERVVAEQILLNLKHTLGKKPSRTLEEKEFIVAMHSTWADARELGLTEGEARALLTVLRSRGIAVPQAARKRILAEKDAARLERWIEKAATAATLEEALGEPADGPRRRRPAPH